MTTARATPNLSGEELAFSIFLGLMAIACAFVAGKATDGPMAFHATLGAIAAIAGAVAIVKFNLDGFVAPPQMIDG